jgi:preprotein translocase subunit SecG
MQLFGEITSLGYILNGVLIVLSLIMVFIILIQRGKGGGLAGAFGGAGGSSAFGSRAGDAFTKVTLYFALVWVLVIMINVKVMKPAVAAPPDETKAPSAAPAETPAENPPTPAPEAK